MDPSVVRLGRALVVAIAAALGLALPAAASAAGPVPNTSQKLEKASASFHGDVRRLRGRPEPPRHERPEREPPSAPLHPPGKAAPVGSGTLPGGLAAPSTLNSFDGLFFSQDCGGVSCGDGHPPDTNGDVGPRYFIQTVNTAVGIFDKSNGSRVAGFSFNALMSQGNFGNLCDTDNFGDPVVLYDSFHDRWIITDFAFQLDSSDNVVNPPGSYQCFAVSRTGDPVGGGWNFYSLHITDALQDYPKFGVWPDGLYMSANMFGFSANGSFQNSRVWALNLAQMEAGAATPQVVSFNAQSKIQGVSVFTLLPSNARAQTGTPPAGRPNLFTSVWGWTDRVRVWQFHVDWANTANSTFTGPTDSTTGSTWTGPPDSVPSKNGNALDTLAIRLMMQNQYTNLNGVESLWNSHTVQGSSSSQSAVRWYQVPVTGGTIGGALQASTWNPGSDSRFMPSLAVDKSSDMAIGYSVSSSTLFPAIRYAGRLASDPLNTLGQSETSLIEGTGTQTGNCGGSACGRWGDYSAMTLDPDGCTFWYTNEYYVTSGLDDHTRIGSFQLPGCTPIAMGTLQGTVTDSSTTNPISGATVTAGNLSTTTNASGAYSFPSIPAGSYTVTVTAPGHLASSANGVSVSSAGTTTHDFALDPGSVGTATKLAFTSSTASVASGATKTLTVEIHDASDHLVTSDNSTVVTFAKTSGSGTVTGLGTATASGGVVQKTVTGATAGSLTVTATASGLTVDTSTFNVTPGAATQLAFTSSTSSVTSGATKTLTVEIRDANGNLESSDNSTVVTFAKTAGSGTVTGLGTATASGGVAQKTVTGATAGSVTVQATATGLTAASSTFSVTPGVATKLVFTSSTGSVASGATKSLTVEVRDANNNPETGDNSTVVTFAKTSGAGTVTGLGTATAGGGIAQKTVTGATAGSVTITATATGLTSDSSTFSVTPGVATQLAFTSSTSSVASGATKTLTVEIRDANGNLESSDNATVVTFAKTSGSGTVTGLGTATASGGVAQKTVTGAAAGSVTVQATATGLTAASSTFSVTPGAATKLAFTSSTASVASGATKTLTVEIRDANDNLVSSDNSTVVTFAKTSGSGTATGLGTATAGGGIAQKVVTGGTAGSVTVTATATGLTSDSSTFSVTPGAATKLVFTSSTGSVAPGATKSLTVEIRDANDNVETGDNSTVVTFAKTSGTGTVTGLGTATASGGIAQKTVTGGTAGSVTVTASATGVSSDSSTFSVTIGPATKLAFTSSTASVASGATKTLTVEIRDANDNLETGDNATVVTFGQSSGAGSVTGLGTATASGGIAQKTVTGATAGSVTITASASGLTSDGSTFSVTPGPVSKLVITSTSAGIATGAQKTITAEVRDASDNLESSDNSTAVTFAQTSGTGSVTGLGSATASGGIAQKTVTGETSGSVTVTASATGLTSDATAFVVNPPAPTQLAFTSDGAGVASGAQKQLTVEVRDASGTKVSSSASVTLTKTSGGGSVSGLPATVNAVDGVATVPVTGVSAGSVDVQATSSGLSSATTSFSVTPGTPDHLAFTSPTSNLASGTGRNLTVELRDASGNRTSSSADVAITQSSGSGSATGVPASVHALNGVATFSVTGAAAGPLGLTATSAGLTSGVTAFTVGPGAADHLAFTSASNDLASGSTRNLTVEVRDASGNHVSSSADVMFTRTSGPGTVTGLPATVTASGGDASHQVTGFLGGPITITASAPALGSGSTSFKIAPGPKRRRLTLRRSGLALSGRVTSRSLVCRARVPLRIEVTPKGKRPETLKRMKTTKAGGFRVRFRKSGVYRVVVPVAPGCAGVRSKATRLRSAAGR